jgi:hypothetical protein
MGEACDVPVGTNARGEVGFYVSLEVGEQNLAAKVYTHILSSTVALGFNWKFIESFHEVSDVVQL